jgi:hypothetical protein
MRKVFLVLLVLSLSSMFISCSDSEDAVTPTPETDALAISTAATLTTGYTCSPYSIQMEATGGTEPYTWALSAGSSMPAGMGLSSDGVITGMMETAGNHDFSIVCTDNASATDEVAFSLGVEALDNPSIAIFFDEAASVCSEDITYPATLDCYAYIMPDEGTYPYAAGASFKINLLDAEGNALVSGVDYFLLNTTYPTYPNLLTLGHPSTGLSEVFYKQPFTDPVMLCSFSLMLTESRDKLAFEIAPHPDDMNHTTNPIILDGDNIAREVLGHKAAINY